MPCVDMPLEELKTYMGTNPCPADIDEYWDDALKEMNSVEANPVFEKADFPYKNGESYDLYFTGTKNARIHCKFMKPLNVEGKVPAVLLFHGLGGAFHDWVELVKYVAQGYVVAAMDCRGQGGQSEDVGGTVGPTFSSPFTRGLSDDKHNLLQRDMFLDTALLAKIVMGLPYVDEGRIGVTGGSQGGGLSVACAALVPEIKKCAPVFPYLSDYKRVWDMDLDAGAYDGLRYYFRRQDPRHEREDEIFEKLGYVDIQNLAKRIKAEVLMATGLRDTTCPPSTQFAMYNKLTCKKNVLIYHDYGHEELCTHADIIFKFLSDL